MVYLTLGNYAQNNLSILFQLIKLNIKTDKKKQIKNQSSVQVSHLPAQMDQSLLQRPAVGGSYQWLWNTH